MKNGQRSFLQNIEVLFDGGVIGEQTDRQLRSAIRGPQRTSGIGYPPGRDG